MVSESFLTTAGTESLLPKRKGIFFSSVCYAESGNSVFLSECLLGDPDGLFESLADTVVKSFYQSDSKDTRAFVEQG